jgi:hypothetical protein
MLSVNQVAGWRTMAARPIRSLRGGQDARLVLGHARERSVLPFLPRSVSLRGADVHQHKHVIGLTGQGKSKLLASLFAQLHSQGIACGLIDPHSDLALDCLRLLHERGQRLDGVGERPVLYIDFAQHGAYLPFNVLLQPYDAHTVARNLVEVCKRAWPALADGAAPTFENILLHAAVVLVENDYPLTLLSRLLTEKHFRDMSLAKVTDTEVVRFFRQRYDGWGREGALMRESTLNRVALLTFSPTLRYSLGQRENVLDFRRHMDEGVSVIYNLGGLDEATQTFLGCLLTVGYEVAALSRTDLPEQARRPWHLILDEFSQFSATTESALARVLSRARKYGLCLTLAHQTWSQVSERLAGALQNTLAIAFKLGRSDAEWAAPRFGRFEPQAVKHAVADPQALERTHPLFVSLAEAFEGWTKALEDLRPREAYVKHGPEAVKVRTVTVPPARGDAALERVIQAQRSRLLRPAAQVISEVDAILRDVTQPAAPQRRVALG